MSSEEGDALWCGWVCVARCEILEVTGGCEDGYHGVYGRESGAGASCCVVL
jgi:hypothetical protein